jgi:hypothetical protein
MQQVVPLWLTRPEDVQAHLMYAAAEIASCVITVNGLQVHGSIAPPESSGDIPFMVDPRLQDLVEIPATGRAVRVDYEGGTDRYTFYSEMVGTDILHRWVLAPPRTVQRTDRRIVARHRVMGHDGFHILMEVGNTIRSFEITDISNAGLAFLYQSSDASLREGHSVEGHVEIPGLDPVPVRLEVRNIRKSPGKRGYRIAGLRFIELARPERMAIAGALAAWKHQRRITQRAAQ